MFGADSLRLRQKNPSWPFGLRFWCFRTRCPDFTALVPCVRSQILLESCLREGSCSFRMRSECGTIVFRSVPIIIMAAELQVQEHHPSATTADPKSSLSAQILSQFQPSTLRLFSSSLSIRLSGNVEESKFMHRNLLDPESSIHFG